MSPKAIRAVLAARDHMVSEPELTPDVVATAPGASGGYRLQRNPRWLTQLEEP